MIKHVTGRLRAACRTNEPQFKSVTLLSAMTVATLFMRPGYSQIPWQVWMCAGLFWPAFAFTANLLSPLPVQKRDG